VGDSFRDRFAQRLRRPRKIAGRDDAYRTHLLGLGAIARICHY
jgi:hypothetical protein